MNEKRVLLVVKRLLLTTKNFRSSSSFVSDKKFFKEEQSRRNNLILLKKCSEVCLPTELHLVSTFCTNMQKVPTLKEVVRKLEEFAPLSLAESWDNVGLLIEPGVAKPIKTIFFTNDLTELVLEEAVASSADLIISYHPPLFRALKKITQETWKERIVAKCLKEEIAVYSPHTCWDAVSGGVNDWLAKALPPGKLNPIVPNKTYGSSNFSHFVTFEGIDEKLKVSVEKLDEGDSGVRIVDFGKGFRPGNFNLIVLSTAAVLPKLLNSAKKTESANVSVASLDKVFASNNGVGRLYKLENPASVQELITKVKEHLNLPKLQVALAVNHKLDEKVVNSVGICAGSGASVLNGVPAQLYLTGEMSHHEVLEANHNGSSVILTHHSNSERGFLTHFANKLSQDLSTDGFNAIMVVSKTDKDPLVIM